MSEIETIEGGSICFAVTWLFDAVNRRLCDDRLEVDNFFGWKEPTRMKLSNRRIVWVPGDPDGSVGAITSAKYPGQNPRSLATLNEVFTCYISSRNPAKPEDERAQYESTRYLFDAWYRASYLAAPGVFAVTDSAWNTSKIERRAGAEIICQCTIEAIIPDAIATTAIAEQVASTATIGAYSETATITD